MRRIVVLVVAGVGLAAAKERKRGTRYLRGVGNIFRNKASTQRNRALKHLAKLDKEVAAMKSDWTTRRARPSTSIASPLLTNSVSSKIGLKARVVDPVPVHSRVFYVRLGDPGPYEATTAAQVLYR